MSAFDFTASLIAGAVRQTVSLRPYQQKAEAETYQAWNLGFQNVLIVIPTGGGKTQVLTSIVNQHEGTSCIFAHRMELVTQIALKLNEYGIRFQLICPKKVRQAIIETILRKHGVCYHDTNARVAVAGVDTLVKIPTGKDRARYANFLATCSLWVCDEAHHPQAAGEDGGKTNKWGRATEIFTNPKLKGLGVTATPKRADGGGLSRDTDGLFDYMVLGPTLKELFDSGYLCPYDIYCVPCSVAYENVGVGASGEFVQAKLVAAEDAAEGLVGDIVSNYLRLAPGKKGVYYVSSVHKAKEVAQRFNDNGVPARAVDGTLDPDAKSQAIQDLESGKILLLINCDLYGEGTDLPVLEVVGLGTATNSLGRFMQWVGRLYRLLLTDEQKIGYDALTDEQRRQRIAESPKPYGILIDHGNNVVRHEGPPEVQPASGQWLLGRYSKKSVAGETVPYRVCANPGLVLTNPNGHTWEAYRKVGWTNEAMLNAGHLAETATACAKPYERIFRACPYCGFMPEPVGRADPVHVEGDLVLLDQETRDALYEKRRKAVMTEEEFAADMLRRRVPGIGQAKQMKAHQQRLLELGHLGRAMALWGGHWKREGDTDSMMQRRFFHIFQVDVISAQALERPEAEALRAKIENRLGLDGVDMSEYAQGFNNWTEQ